MKFVTIMIYLGWIIASHVITLKHKTPKGVNGRIRFYVPYVIVFLMNYFVWDLVLGPMLSFAIMKTELGKKFYERMILKRTEPELN